MSNPIAFYWQKQFDHTPLLAELERIRVARSKGYDTIYSALNVSFDSTLLDTTLGLAAQKRELNPALMLIIGIGGSMLGMQALVDALLGCSYNQNSTSLKIYSIDTIEPTRYARILDHMSAVLNAGREVLILVITKSGTTTETVANFEIALERLMRARPRSWASNIVAITDRHSPLWQCAVDQKWSCLEIPRTVGGRYSVFTPVGMFGLAMLGIETRELMRGAQDAVNRCLRDDQANPAVQSALFLFDAAAHGFTIADLFLFDASLESLGKWYRQLMGESIGKQGKGLTPTVSIGTTDLHSMAQLYLDGPRDKVTMFVTVKQSEPDIIVPTDLPYQPLVDHLRGNSLNTIMDAIIVGVKRAYELQKLPFMTIELSERSAYTLGYVMQYKMIEMMLLGHLLQVNPFDQPAVELYKEQTRRELAHE